MRLCISTLLACLLPLQSAGAAELTVLGGSQGGGQLQHIGSQSTLHLAQRPARALILGTPMSHYQDLELYYGQQQTRLQSGNGVSSEELFDLDVHYLHAGGTVLSPRREGAQLFLSGGIGIAHFSPSLGGAAAETRASLSMGGGLRWLPSSRLGLRLEARAFGSLFNSNTSVFCSGGCRFIVSGDLLTQYAILAGVTLRLD